MAAAAWARSAPAGTDVTVADLVLRGGEVLTFADWTPGSDPGRVSAIAVKDGLVLATGTDDEVSSHIGAATRVVELGGRAVIPGINDVHLHVVAYAMARFGLRDVSSATIGTWEGLHDALTPESVGEDGWIRAQGWDASALGRPGTAADVDRALSAHGIAGSPTVLFDRTGHQLLVGSATLQRLGIGATTPDPPGGAVEHDADGHPTGVFTDAATALVLARMPRVPAGTLVRVLRRAQRELAALGITSLTDPGIGPGHATLFDGSASPLALDALTELALSGDLTVRTAVLLTFGGTGGETAENVRSGLTGALPNACDGVDPRMLRIAGVKVFADGIQRSGTAWHHEPYGPSARRGQLAVAGATDAERIAELDRILAEIARSGRQAGIHATGDAASDAVVESLLSRPEQTRATRPYLIHGDFLPVAGMDSLAAGGIGWAANPVISRMVCGIGLELLGHDRQATRQPLASALRAGVAVALSSDAPVVSPDWREAVVTAVERSQTDGHRHPLDPEAVSSVDALAMLTVTPAVIDHAETFKGRLRAGYVADLAVLGGTWPGTEDVRSLLERTIDLTVVGGRIVHET